jgi:hypothetical protein
MREIASTYADDAVVARSDTIAISQHVTDLGDERVVMFPAHQALNGQMTVDDHRNVVTMMLVKAPSRLPGQPLIGLCYALSPDEAREFAAALIRSAKEIEQVAGEQAAAALRKAAGK